MSEDNMESTATVVDDTADDQVSDSVPVTMVAPTPQVEVDDDGALSETEADEPEAPDIETANEIPVDSSPWHKEEVKVEENSNQTSSSEPSVEPVAVDATFGQGEEDNSDDYEIEALALREGRTLDELQQRLLRDAESILEYGDRVVSSAEEYRETLAPAQEVFKIIHEVSRRHPDMLHRIAFKANGKKYELTTEHSLGYPAIGIKVSTENSMQVQTWTASPLKSDTKFNIYEYKEKETQTDDGFESSIITKQRSLKVEDVESLKTALGDMLAESA